jgi:8-oxo-dGTP pyrophosphatase MutT (NUDIX family)
MKKPRKIIAALGLPISSDRKVLLTQRHAPGNLAWHHKWQIAGGSVNPGESLADAAIREVWEELSVRAKILHPTPITKSQVWYAHESDEGMDNEVILNVFLVDIGDQVPDLSHDPDWETAAFGWFTYEEAKNLDCLPLTIPIVEAAFVLIEQNGTMIFNKIHNK